MGDQEQKGSVCVRFNMAAGTSCRVSLPVLFGMLWSGEIIIPSRGREMKVLWLC